VNRRANRPTANPEIILFGCLGGAFLFGTVAFTVAITRAAAPVLSTVATIGTLLMALIASYAWRQMRREAPVEHSSEDDDEDSNPEGGSGVRTPPDAPDGGSSLDFDWDGFVTGFRDYVTRSGSDSDRELARQ
jgi:hypothetical protein